MNSRRNTLPLRVFKFTPLTSTPTSVRLFSRFGIPLVRKSLVVSVTVTISTVSVVSSCSMLLRVSLTRTFPTGTEILSESARTFLLSSVVTRSMSRRERSRPRLLLSTARRTSSTTTSLPSPTTTLRSLSFGSLESSLAVLTLSWLLLLPLLLLRLKLTRNSLPSTSKKWNTLLLFLSPTRMMMTCKQ